MSLPPKSCELDCLPATLFRQCLEYLEEFITCLINKSLQKGEFISSWKKAVLRPLIKKENQPRNDRTNYRPVSNVPFHSKVLEKSALEQIHSHCSRNNLLPPYQSAYRSGYSCETALAKILDDVLHNMEQQKVTVMIFMELSAAFDTVDHGILHDVLEQTFCIKGTCLDWLDSYLQPRSFCVAIGEEYSEEQSLTFSVPQGSCMGLTLYTLYASTLSTVIPEGIDIHGYADDHALKKAFQPAIPGEEELTLLNLSNTMDEVDTWMKANRLKLNPTKTEFVYFGSRRKLLQCVQNNVSITGSLVQRTPNTQYLGIT